MRRTTKSQRRNAVCNNSSTSKHLSETLQKTMMISSEPLVECPFSTRHFQHMAVKKVDAIACKKLWKSNSSENSMKSLRTEVSYDGETQFISDCASNLLEKPHDCAPSDGPFERKLYEKDEKQQKVEAAVHPSRNKFDLINPRPKLPKVKTTRQLVEELNARKDLHSKFLNFSDFTDGKQNFPFDALQNRCTSSSKILMSKSELMQKFLSSIPESSLDRPENNSQSLSVDRTSPQIADNEYFVVISNEKFPSPVKDSKTDENLAVVQSFDLGQIEWSEDYDELPVVKRSITDADVDRYSDRWEFVNGTYSCGGSWKPWQECTESKIFPEETIQILPYVNIE